MASPDFLRHNTELGAEYSEPAAADSRAFFVPSPDDRHDIEDKYEEEHDVIGDVVSPQPDRALSDATDIEPQPRDESSPFYTWSFTDSEPSVKELAARNTEAPEAAMSTTGPFDLYWFDESATAEIDARDTRRPTTAGIVWGDDPHFEADDEQPAEHGREDSVDEPTHDSTGGTGNIPPRDGDKPPTGGSGDGNEDGTDGEDDPAHNADKGKNPPDRHDEATDRNDEPEPNKSQKPSAVLNTILDKSSQKRYEADGDIYREGNYAIGGKEVSIQYERSRYLPSPNDDAMPAQDDDTLPDYRERYSATFTTVLEENSETQQRVVQTEAYIFYSIDEEEIVEQTQTFTQVRDNEQNKWKRLFPKEVDGLEELAQLELGMIESTKLDEFPQDKAELLSRLSDSFHSGSDQPEADEPSITTEPRFTRRELDLLEQWLAEDDTEADAEEPEPANDTPAADSIPEEGEDEDGEVEPDAPTEQNDTLDTTEETPLEDQQPEDEPETSYVWAHGLPIYPSYDGEANTEPDNDGADEGEQEDWKNQVGRILGLTKSEKALGDIGYELLPQSENGFILAPIAPELEKYLDKRAKQLYYAPDVARLILRSVGMPEDRLSHVSHRFRRISREFPTRGLTDFDFSDEDVTYKIQVGISRHDISTGRFLASQASYLHEVLHAVRAGKLDLDELKEHMHQISTYKLKGAKVGGGIGLALGAAEIVQSLERGGLNVATTGRDSGLLLVLSALAGLGLGYEANEEERAAKRVARTHAYPALLRLEDKK